MNNDGSTNNLTDYYRYTRDSWIPTLNKQFVFYTVYGLAIGAMMYFFTYEGMSGPISRDGRTNDYWNAGVVIYFVNVVSHHIMIFAETRDLNLYTVPFYTISFGLLFLVAWMNDVFAASVYRGN